PSFRGTPRPAPAQPGRAVPPTSSRRDTAPRERAPARRLQRIEIVPGAPLDLRFIEAAARGNDLARFLTALPPNVLDAAAYREFLARFAREHALAFEWL